MDDSQQKCSFLHVIFVVVNSPLSSNTNGHLAIFNFTIYDIFIIKSNKIFTEITGQNLSTFENHPYAKHPITVQTS